MVDFKMKAIFYISLVILGLLAGWLIFGSSESNLDNSQEEIIYTCSMHPQIRQPAFGKCPLCGMDLTPVANEIGTIADDGSFEMSASAIALANVETIKAKKSEPEKMLRLYGSIQANERNIHAQTAHISGRIEKLFVSFEGESVRRGQAIASIYSPEILSTQTEFLEALKLKHPALTESAKEKLRLLKITEAQIDELERTGKANPYINIFSDANGIISARRAARGEYVQVGSVLFDVVDLNTVWAVFDAYEADLPYLNVGDLIGYTATALPEQVFTGRIEFISPIVDPVSRTAKVRMETVNKNLKLKPGMLANAMIHNAKVSEEAIILPRSAVLWTGERSIAYVAKRRENGAMNFHLREVKLGASLGNSVIVVSGILENELVVANGVFAVDASAQLAGKVSMMNSVSQNNQGDDMNKLTKLAAIAAICTTAVGCEDHKNHNAVNAQASLSVAEQPAQTAQTVVSRLGVSGACEMCEMKIESTAKSIDGVKNAKWDIETKILNVEFDPSKTNLDAISKAIAAVGYDTEKDKADDAVYNSLPGCCKYRGRG